MKISHDAWSAEFVVTYPNANVVSCTSTTIWYSVGAFAIGLGQEAWASNYMGFGMLLHGIGELANVWQIYNKWRFPRTCPVDVEVIVHSAGRRLQTGRRSCLCVEEDASNRSLSRWRRLLSRDHVNHNHLIIRSLIWIDLRSVIICSRVVRN